MVGSSGEFVAKVAGHVHASAEHADFVVRTALSAIGGYLSPAQRAFITDELPPGLAVALLEADDRALPIEARVETPGVTPARAHELIASVCTALIEALSFDALAILRGVPALHDYFDEPAARSLAASGAGGAVVRRWPTASVAPARERRWFARTRH